MTGVKFVKLDRRYKAFAYGYTHAIRFDCYSKHVSKVEDYLYKTYPGGTSYSLQNAEVWHRGFGLRNSSGRKTYWINVRDEAVITMVILSGVLENGKC